ncbi:replication factor C subunit 2-like [Bolinopsis microptera]|uniref:replication factor C subunit 2-like n=1 Tax=Bolinopsis microptera TaxID=2820187 RepID=UPI00307A3F85
MFAQKKVTISRHKIVILDEADSMTSAAQEALRRTMEIYSKTTRFALACNSSDKIIEPIQSRCTMLRYSRITDAQVLRRLLDICEAESVVKTDDGLEAVIFTAQGDMRQAINNLQSTHQGYGIVNSANVFKVCDEPHPLLVKNMIKHCTSEDIDEAYKILHSLWMLGYSPEDLDIINNVRKVCQTFDMPEYKKLLFLKEIGYTHLRITQGVNSLLQL